MHSEMNALNYLMSAHNGNLLKDAVDTINGFAEDKEHFTVYLYDEEGHYIEVTSKLTAILLEYKETYSEE